VRIFVDPVPDPRLEELLEGGWEIDSGRAETESRLVAAVSDVETVSAAARKADLTRVRPHLAHAIRLLRGAGISLSDRRVVKVQRLVAAAAAMAGRDRATDADLWPLVLAVPTREQQSLARETLRAVLAQSENAALPAAAEEASLGPLARAARIATAGRRAQPGSQDEVESWYLRLEGIAREIDAGFAPEAMPLELAEVRAGIVAALRQVPRVSLQM
jgi:MoxR-like ATPase